MVWITNGAPCNKTFKGAFSNEVHLRLFPDTYLEAGHVVVLPYYEHSFVFAKHHTRGYEWPGGKVELGESALAAAIREVREETGALLSSIWRVGQYTVTEPGHSFVKNIYVGMVDTILEQELAEDSLGYHLTPIHLQPSEEEGYSPLVCDEVYSTVVKALYKG